MLGEGLNRLSTAAKNVAYTVQEKGRDFSNNVQQRGIMNEVTDISAKGWDFMNNVFQKAKEQIVGGGIFII